MNLGMRWDYYSPLSEEYGRIPNFDFSTLGLVFPGVNGVSNTSGVQKDRRDFAPRFGIAAQPNAKTLIRGGFGINYAPELHGTPGAVRFPPYIYSLPTSYTTQPNPYTPVGYFLSDGLPPITPINPNNIVGGIAGVSMNYKTPRTNQYNHNKQHKQPNNTKQKKNKVGNLGRKLSGSNATYQWDGAAPGSASIIGRRVYGAILPNVTSIGLVTSFFNSSYNSLQTTLTHRFQHGLN